MFDGMTGIPELPEGYVWYVGKTDREFSGTGLSISVYYVELIRETKVWYSKKLKGRVLYSREMNTTRNGLVNLYGVPLTEDNIRYTCELIMKDWDKDGKVVVAEEKLIGFYPPNKLGEM